MQDSIAHFAHPILEYGMNLRARLDAGTALDLEIEQATLKKLLLAGVRTGNGLDLGRADGVATEHAGAGAAKHPFPSGIRYGLTVWLDELLLRYSPAAAVWANATMENALYGTADGAWRFWTQADEASSAGQVDFLEVFFLCVMLGFRGDWRGTPQKLSAWIATTRERLTAAPISSRQALVDLEPLTDVPPLCGLEKMKNMVFICGMSLLIVIPFVVLMVVR